MTIAPPLISLRSRCWRAVPAGAERAALAGTTKPGRYNRSGERALYMSGSPEGVAAAMRRYGAASRALVPLDVAAERLADLRGAAVCAALGIDQSATRSDWLAALRDGKEPTSWQIADAVRAGGAMGLIEASRHLPDAWHLVLFRWNEPGGARVKVVSA